MKNNKSPLPESIAMRVIANMEKGINVTEALKLAIEEENNTIWLCLGVNMKTGSTSKDIADKVMSELSTRVYNRINKVQ